MTMAYAGYHLSVASHRGLLIARRVKVSLGVASHAQEDPASGFLFVTA